MKNEKIFFGFLVIVGTFLVSCTSTPHRFNESLMNSNLPMSEHAVLTSEATSISAVNGITSSLGRFNLLPPGRYTFSVYVNTEEYTSSKMTISGTFEAGHIYRIIPLINGYYRNWDDWPVRLVSFVIVDETDPEIWREISSGNLGFKLSPFSRTANMFADARRRNEIIKQLIENGNEGVPRTFEEKFL